MTHVREDDKNTCDIYDLLKLDIITSSVATYSISTLDMYTIN